MLIADVRRRAFEVDVDPLAALEAVGGLQTRRVALATGLISGREHHRTAQCASRQHERNHQASGFSPFLFPNRH